MPSDRKITANRNNAKKSTGPRSIAGREAARPHARRHGLSVALVVIRTFHEDIEKVEGESLERHLASERTRPQNHGLTTMPSDGKITANRNNAKKSSGPPLRRGP